MPIFTQPRLRGQSYLEEMRASQGASNLAAAELNIDPVQYLSRIQQLDEAQYGKPVTAPGIFPPVQIGREQPDSPMLSAETARARVTENQLDLTIPDEGIPERALEILIERKRRERVLQDTIARAPQGFLPSAIRFATTLGSSMLDPINVASAFVPVVGAARYASMMSRTSSFLGRAAVRARVGAIEGAVGAAMVEPIVAIGAISEQSDYGLATALTDTALGGVLGGGLHVAIGAAGDAATRTTLGRASAIARNLDAGELSPAPTGFEQTFATRVADAAPETREALLRVAVAQMAEGRTVNIDALARLDPVIRGEVPGASAASQPVDLSAPDLAAEVASVAEQAQAARAAPAENAASVPFMITQAQRAELRTRGFSDEAVRDMTPQQAQDVLRASQTGEAPSPDVRTPEAQNAAPEPAQGQQQASLPGEPAPRPAPAQKVRGASKRAVTYTRPSDNPVSPQAWGELQSNARLGATPESTLADPVAARAADEAVQAGTKADTDTAAITEETNAVLDDIATLTRDQPELDVAVKAELETADLTKDADTYGKASKAMANCQLRRGTGGAAKAATTVAPGRAAAVREAIGNEPAFRASMQEIESMSATDVRALSKEITGLSATSKTRALRNIENAHQQRLTHRARAAATAGRSAA